MPGSNKVIPLRGEQREVRASTMRPGVREGRAELEANLAKRLAAGDPGAERDLLELHGARVERILTRILGAHPDLDDLVQEVFVRAFERFDELEEPLALPAWLTSIAVFVGREAIRRKMRRRWLVFLPAEVTPDVAAPGASVEARAALRAFYEVVGTLDADRRIAFTLRFVEGMELAEIARACGVSLATIKRRLQSAEADFSARGMARAELVDWFEEGTRWR